MLSLHHAAQSRFDDALAVAARFLAEHGRRTTALRPLPVLIDTALDATRLRSWLAHHAPHGVCAGVAFVPAQDALEALLVRASVPPDAAALPGRWWWSDPGTDHPWSVPTLTGRILDVWREHASAAELRALKDYVSPKETSRGTVRRVLLAQQVAERIHRASQEDAASLLTWASEPAAAEAPDRWFRFTLRQLEPARGPAGVRSEPDAAALAARVDGPVAILGLADADPATVGLLGKLGEHLDLCWVRPTTRHGAELSSPRAERAQALESSRREGLPPGTVLDLAAPPHRSPVLGAWQAALTGAEPPPVDKDALGRVLLPAWNARREVEQLRDQLLVAFKEDSTLGPRHVTLLTPDLATYGPLLLQVFSQHGNDKTSDDRFPPEEDSATTPAAPDASTASSGPGAVPAIPLHLVGLGLTATNPIAAALLAVLDQLTDRLTVSGLHGVLSVPQVRRRFGLGRIDASRLRALLRDSGARWGLDGARRGQVYGGDHPVHSIAFGVQRMALGALVHDELDPSSGAVPTQWGPSNALLFPADVGSRDEISEVAALQVAVSTLRTWHAELHGDPRTGAAWTELLDPLLHDLVTTGATTRFLRQEVLDVARDALPGAVSMDAPTVLSLLRTRFERGVAGDAKGLAAVQVRSLEARHVHPARLVVLLGMNAGAFPRRDDRPAWLPEGTAPSRTARDRQAFTAAVLAARDDLWITWTARDPRRGEEMPPSSLVDDLIDALKIDDTTRKELVRARGLHPWSEGARITWSAQVAEAAQQRVTQPPSAPFVTFGKPLPEPPAPDDARAEPEPLVLTLDELQKALLNPSRAFAYDRLRVWVAGEEDPLVDDDPLLVGSGLPVWNVRERLLQWELARDPDDDRPPEDLLRAMVGTGLLPAGGLGEHLLQSHVAFVQELVGKYRALEEDCTVNPSQTVQVDLTVDGRRVTVRGEVGTVVSREIQGLTVNLLRTISPSTAESPKQYLRAWLQLLLRNAARMPTHGARIHGKSGSSKTKVEGLLCRWQGDDPWLRVHDGLPAKAPTTETTRALLERPDLAIPAMTHLASLVAVALEARKAALPLFEHTSHVISKTVVTQHRDKEAPTADEARREVIAAALGKWAGYRGGDRGDRFVSLLHADLDLAAHLDGGDHTHPLRPPDTWRNDHAYDLALRVWWPIVLARHTVSEDVGANTYLSWSKQ